MTDLCHQSVNNERVSHIVVCEFGEDTFDEVRVGIREAVDPGGEIVVVRDRLACQRCLSCRELSGSIVGASSSGHQPCCSAVPSGVASRSQSPASAMSERDVTIPLSVESVS